ncbi:MAG: tetratricopeptide repeat protein [Treponema sp.]|jgi:tetratricopeptide (TPR) repeat protein|nr:tetratricopeptide repeat protein [Treponema sp.]
MLKERYRSEYGVQVHRKQTIRTAVVAVFIFIVASFGILFFISWRNQLGNERRELLELWEKGSYEQTFAISRDELSKKPMDYFFLTLHGFSAYQLAIAQINSFDTLTFIDSCIWSLRKALLTRETEDDGPVYYVLGKAYYYKGTAYAELAVKFLEKARSVSYQARDIPEYLGLAYASIQDYRNSVAAFTLALEPPQDTPMQDPGEGDAYPSDLLLLAIARSYIALDETDAAKAYLVRCVDISRDFDTIVMARLLLGGIFSKAGDAEGAETQYMAILNEGGENAEAHYQLGELYAAAGDPTRARAEWRRAVRIDPAHGPARVRLNM